MGKIRILQLISDLDIGGTEMMLKSLVERLDKKRFEVIICSIKPIGPIGHALKKEGFKVISLGETHKIAFPIALLKLTSIIKQERIALVQSYLFTDNVLARFAKYLTGVPVIDGKRDTDRYKPSAIIKLDNMTLNIADLTISNSISGAKELEGRGEDKRKIRVIFSGIDPSNYAPKTRYQKLDRNSAIRIGVVAKLRKQKGHRYLFESFVNLRREYPNAKVYLVGNGPIRKELEDRVRSMGMDDRILFLGDRKDVPRLLPTFDLFVLPSLWEGTPRALLEAMASGLPIVATRVDGTAEAIRDGKEGLLVPSKKPKPLVAAMIRLIKSPSLRKTLGTNARKRVDSDYSIDKMVKRYEKIYEDLTASRL